MCEERSKAVSDYDMDLSVKMSCIADVLKIAIIHIVK